MFWGSFFQGVSGEHVVIVCSDSSASGFHCTSHEMRGVAVVMMKTGNGHTFAETIIFVLPRFVLLRSSSSVFSGTKRRTSRNRSSWHPASNLFPGLLWSVHIHDGGVADHPRCTR